MLTNPPVPFDFCVAFNQEKALVGAFSVIVQPVVEPIDRFAALPQTTDCDSADLESELSVPSAGEGSYHSSGPRHTTMPILEVSSH